MEEKQSTNFPDVIRELNHQTFLDQLTVVTTTQLNSEQ